MAAARTMEVPSGGLQRKRDPQMSEFDAIDRWGPSLASYLGEVVPAKAYKFLRDRKLKYFEEYRDVLFRRRA